MKNKPLPVGWVLTHQPASHPPTAAQSPAESPPPSQGAPAPAAGEGWGGGSDRITISAAQTPPDKHSPHTYTLSAQVYVNRRTALPHQMVPSPRGGGLGWGLPVFLPMPNSHSRRSAIHGRHEKRRAQMPDLQKQCRNTNRCPKLRRITPLPRKVRQHPQRGRDGVGVATELPSPMPKRHPTNIPHIHTPERSTCM